jgi:V8-like Glu-specific endopeptidase
VTEDVTFDLAAFESQLSEAVEGYDEPTAESLCEELGGHLARTDFVIEAATAGRILTMLRGPRFFRLLSMVAESIIQSGQMAPLVLLRYAQALIDQGLPAAAEAILDSARARLDRDPAGEAELAGMLGRVYKQMYVACAPETERAGVLLRKALDAYLRGEAAWPGTRRWHMINRVALQARAVRDGLAPADTHEEEAAGLLADIGGSYRDPQAALSPWDCAIAAEASVALGRHDDAVAWLERYAADPRVDSFQLASTLRQLVEVWELTATTEPGRSLIPLLQARILDRSQGGAVEIEHSDMPGLSSAPGQEASGGLERILGHDGMVTYRWYFNGLERSKAVAHIGDTNGRPVGTGFLVRGSDLSESLGTGPVLVTNAHVIGDTDGAGIGAGHAIITFQARAEANAQSPVECRATDVAWTSPPSLLDTSLIRLDRGVPDTDVCPLAETLPRLDGKQRVYVIGHPQGRSISFSIADNLLLDHDDRFVHYRAPTEPGSSGSPVFNRNWDVIGLHHAGRTNMQRLHGSGTYPANEGIWIGAIRTALAAGPLP